MNDEAALQLIEGLTEYAEDYLPDTDTPVCDVVDDLATTLLPGEPSTVAKVKRAAAAWGVVL